MVRRVGGNYTQQYLRTVLKEQYDLTGLVVTDHSLHQLTIRQRRPNTTKTRTSSTTAASDGVDGALLDRNMDRSTNFAGRYFWGHCIHHIDQPPADRPPLKNLTFVRDNLFAWATRQQQRWDERQQQQQQMKVGGTTDGRGYTTPPSNAIVLHLRLGDVIEKSKDSVVKMLYRGGNPQHHVTFANSIKNVSEYLDAIREAETDLQQQQQQDSVQSGTTSTGTPTTALKVVIRGGSHVSQDYVKSRRYATCIKEAIIEAGYHDVEMVVEGQNPDHDFYYMSHAKYFVASVGGYSRLIWQMVELLGGKVIGRVF